MKGKSENIEVDDDFIDSIVDEIVDSVKKEDIKFRPDENLQPADLQRRNLSETDKLRSRIAALENRIGKFSNSFKINAIEIERELSERYRGLEEENEKQIVRLQGQVEDLRTAMIRLSNEVKRIREILSPSK